MRHITTILMCAAVALSATAQKYAYQFNNTPISQALVQLSRNHPDTNIAFIYRELDNYRTSAHVNTDDISDALHAIIGSNPINITRKGKSFFIESRLRGKHICSGRVINDRNEPVDASVLLFSSNDSTLVAFGITAENGTFSIPCDKRGLYLKITGIGYEEFSASVPKNGRTGTITLKTSPIALDGVTVTAAGVVSRADKSTIYVSRTLKERADNALNVLSQTSFMCPEIRVNELLKTITVNGQEAIILVNGVRRDMSYLNSIDPDRITRIEFTNYADIQYGVPYIDIRINMAQQGGYLTADGFSDLNSKRETHMLTGGYRYDDHEFNIKYDGTFRDNKKEYTHTESQYISPVDDIRLTENGLPSPIIDNEHKIQLGYTNMRSSGQMLMVTASLKSHNSDKHVLNSVSGNANTGEYDQVISRNYRYLQPSTDLYFRKEAGPYVFEINTAASYLGGKFGRSIYQSWGYDEKNRTENRVMNLQAETALTQKFKSHTTKYGISYTVNRINNSYIFSSSANETDRETSHTAYAYINASGNIAGTGYSAGIGARYHNMTRNKLSVKGVVNISRNLGNGWNASYLLSADPESPNLSMLTDVITPVNNYLYQTGNKAMKSALRFNNRLNIRYAVRKLSLSSSVSYATIHNPIYMESYFDSTQGSATEGWFVSRPANGRKSNRFATELSAGLSNVFGILSVSLNGGWSRLTFDSGTSPTFTSCRWNLGINTFLWYRNWSLDFFYTPFLSQSMNGNTLKEEIKFSYISLGWKYRGFDFSLTASNPFSNHGFSQRSRNISDVHPEYTRYYIKDQANLVSIGVRYSVNFGKLLKKGERTLRTGSIDDGIDSNY